MGIPSALLADICSERVILACSAAKAIPGDVWFAGAEGHYAFLCGLAALMRLPEIDEYLGRDMRNQKRWIDSETPMICPPRVLVDLGLAQAIEARSDETRSGSAEGESAVRKDAPSD